MQYRLLTFLRNRYSGIRLLVSAFSFVPVIFTLFLLSSCGNDQFGRRKPVAEAGGKYLYEEDVKNIFYEEMSREDSLAIVDNYIRSWATDILMYEKAQENIRNEEKISYLLENYRRSLLIYEYQLQLVNNRLNNSISPQEIKSYYASNHQLFELKETLIKGLFLKIPNQAPDMETLRALVSSTKSKNLDKIESLCIKNAAKFEYFNKEWQPLIEIQRRSPIRGVEKEMLKQRSFYESRDSLSTYFLFVEEYKLEGEAQPLEYAESRIRGILLEQRKNNYLKQFSNELYEEALKMGKVKIYEPLPN